MGNFFNSIWNMFSTEPNEEENLEENKISEPPKSNSTIRTSKVEYNKPKSTYSPTPLTEMPRTATTTTVTQVKPAAYKAEKPGSSKLCKFEPKSVDDSKKVIEYLSHGYAVIINLENIDSSLSQRIVDVVSGALYLLDGTYQIITNNIYLMAPNGVEIKSPLTTESVIDNNIEKSMANNTFTFSKK